MFGFGLLQKGLSALASALDGKACGVVRANDVRPAPPAPIPWAMTPHGQVYMQLQQESVNLRRVYAREHRLREAYQDYLKLRQEYTAWLRARLGELELELVLDEVNDWPSLANIHRLFDRQNP